MTRTFGVVFMLIGLLANPWTLMEFCGLQALLSVPYFFYKLIYIDIFLFSFGLFLYFYKPLKSRYRLMWGTVFALIVVCEILIKIFPEAFGQRIANKVRTKYKVGITGIYEYQPHLGFLLMKPDFETVCYLNGYRWHHQTDAKGFRNAVDRDRADIVLLGDSFIYGHGVEIEETLGHHLEALSGRPVVNLARQGDCPLQQRYLLKTYGLDYRPMAIVYFFFDNDLTDLYHYLSDEEKKRFIATSSEEFQYKKPDPDHIYRSTSFRWGMEIFWNSFFLSSLIKTGTWGVLHRLFPEHYPYINPSKSPVSPAFKPDSLEWQYAKKAILDMDRMAKEAGARFYIVKIPAKFAKADTGAVLSEFAAVNGIPFIQADFDIHTDPEYYLPRDGHFTNAGAMAMAELVYEHIKNK